jgi:hypothetical protein
MLQSINVASGGNDRRQQQVQVNCCDKPVSECSLWTALIILLLLLVVMVPCVFLSFHVVSYDQVAYAKDVYGTVDTSKLYQNGRYFLPLTQTMVYFDNTYEPIAFLSASNAGLMQGIDASSSVANPPLSVALSDGVEIHIEIFFVYRIDHKQLAALYNQYGTSYVSQIVAISVATIKSAITGFQQTDYVFKRRLVESTVALSLEQTLANELGVYAPRNKVKLVQVLLPDSVINTNLDAVISPQFNEVALLQQQVTAIESETQRQIAVITAQQTQVISQSYIDSNRTIAFAQNFANNVVTGARARGQALFFDTLGITNQTTQIQFVRLLNLLDSTGNITLVQQGFKPLLQV